MGLCFSRFGSRWLPSGTLHRRTPAGRQLRRKGAPALVAGIFLDEVLYRNSSDILRGVKRTDIVGQPGRYSSRPNGCTFRRKSRKHEFPCLLLRTRWIDGVDHDRPAHRPVMQLPHYILLISRLAWLRRDSSITSRAGGSVLVPDYRHNLGKCPSTHVGHTPRRRCTRKCISRHPLSQGVDHGRSIHNSVEVPASCPPG